MDTPDFRALCAQLVGYLQGRKDNECGWPGEDPEQDLIDATNAALEAVPATPAPVPVVAHPVSMRDRQPTPEDCDAQRRCWTTHYNPEHVYTPVWGMTYLPDEDLGHNFSNAYFWRAVTHWLPHWALPLPEPTK